MDAMIDLQTQMFCFLGKGSLVKGELNFEGDTIISSRVEGDIIMQSVHLLTLQRESQVQGTIKCYDAILKGHFEGKLESQGKVVIYPTARVTGEINARQLVILPGAQVNMQGHTLEHLDRPEASQA